ncbi:MAG: phosphonopyruvate decarboxylase [Thermoplasmata archaeon]|nr:phosphonopyruvate decarboxylase [Thermoplasmata archaeon]
MDVKDFVDAIDANFFTGVPDSQLKALCDYLMCEYGIDPNHHIIAANEGNCVGIAAGYHMATEKVPVVYLQNSGEGNIINPVASLLNKDVYGIPCIFIVGWRGEPGVHDEPQHIYQGKVTESLLDVMGIDYMVLSSDTSAEEVVSRMAEWRTILSEGGQVAFVVRKGALSFDGSVRYEGQASMLREEIIRSITQMSGNDPIISTTGKTSRELFEIREASFDGHSRDFLTVGSMGHASSIALGVAIKKPSVKVWCIDGDGAAIMHMGAMSVIGSVKPKNLIHVVINNNAHESVGGMPTSSVTTDLCSVARACGYANVFKASNPSELSVVLSDVRSMDGPSFVEVDAAIGSRPDLGRPTTSSQENMVNFMKYLREI